MAKRVYAVGDIHGQLDYFKTMIADFKSQGDDFEIILTGDVTDRGKDSYGMFMYIRELKAQGVQITHLLGNHDDFYSNSDSGFQNLEFSIKDNQNGVLTHFETAFNYYADDANPLITGPIKNKSKNVNNQIYHARMIYDRLGGSAIQNDPKYKGLCDRINTTYLQDPTVLADFGKAMQQIEGWELKNGKRAGPSSYSEQDIKVIFFLCQILCDQEEYFSQLPLITTKNVDGVDYVFTHSGFVPVHDKGTGTERMLTDAEIKADYDTRMKVLWGTRSGDDSVFLTREEEKNGAPNTGRETPLEKICGHIVGHGHTSTARDDYCARSYKNEFCAINLDAGAYGGAKSFRAFELSSRKLASYSSGGAPPGHVKIQRYQVEMNGGEGKLVKDLGDESIVAFGGAPATIDPVALQRYRTDADDIVKGRKPQSYFTSLTQKDIDGLLMAAEYVATSVPGFGGYVDTVKQALVDNGVAIAGVTPTPKPEPTPEPKQEPTPKPQQTSVNDNMLAFKKQLLHMAFCYDMISSYYTQSIAKSSGQEQADFKTEKALFVKGGIRVAHIVKKIDSGLDEKGLGTEVHGLQSAHAQEAPQMTTQYGKDWWSIDVSQDLVLSIVGLIKQGQPKPKTQGNETEAQQEVRSKESRATYYAGYLNGDMAVAMQVVELVDRIRIAKPVDRMQPAEKAQYDKEKAALSELYAVMGIKSCEKFLQYEQQQQAQRNQDDKQP